MEEERGCEGYGRCWDKDQELTRRPFNGDESGESTSGGGLGLSRARLWGTRAICADLGGGSGFGGIEVSLSLTGWHGSMAHLGLLGLKSLDLNRKCERRGDRDVKEKCEKRNLSIRLVDVANDGHG